MQFSTEVLPAPFGPMSASSSPSCASKETSRSTCRPPKASDTELSASAAIPSAIPSPAAAVLLDVAITPARGAVARTQVELADVLVRAQALGRAVEHHAAVLHHVAVVG